MTYVFQGFFVATADEAQATVVLREAQSAWPHAAHRRIEQPFVGAAVCWTWDVRQERERPERLDEQLGPWTRQFPTLTFVRLSAECFGGRCDYGGTVWRNGQALLHEDDASDGLGYAPLLRLLRYLGITSGTGYFEPLTRGYFQPQR
jgi:hypothetical protein